jgi:clan AA aspartic protease (TIGR02281 family)
VQALYQSALDKGYSAATLAQSAEAPSDWEFVALRWQAAIADLQTIPAGTPPHATAQTKIGQYQQGLNYAQQQAKNPAAPPPQIVARSEPAPTNSPTPNLEELPPPNGELITQVPIRGRVSGIPVVDVTINGQAFPMMLDTGASGTVLTQGMAQQLALASTGTVQVNTPSHQGITMPTARLSAISVGSITVGNLEVIVSPSMDVGLLGQNFFGGYDVTIRQDRVEFHSRG